MTVSPPLSSVYLELSLAAVTARHGSLPRSEAVAFSGTRRRQGYGKRALIVMALSLISADTFNADTGAFQVLAFAGMWHRFKAVSVTVRLVPYVCVMAVGAAIAYLGYTSFVTSLTSFLDVLLVIFIPWYASTWPATSWSAAAPTMWRRSPPSTRLTGGSPGGAAGVYGRPGCGMAVRLPA